MITISTSDWAFKPTPTMFFSSSVRLKRGDVVYSNDLVRQLPWGECNNWKGIQIVDAPAFAYTLILLENTNGVLESSNPIIITSDTLDSLIRTGRNWSGYEILSDKNSCFIIAKRHNSDGHIHHDAQMHMKHAEFIQLKKTGIVNIDAQLGSN